jgi:hypothetical protein
VVYLEGGGMVRGFEGGGGGSELTRKHHDSGEPALKNHQLEPSPLVKGRISGGGVRYGSCTVDLSVHILVTQFYVPLSTTYLGPKLRINDKSGFLAPICLFFAMGLFSGEEPPPYKHI